MATAPPSRQQFRSSPDPSQLTTVSAHKKCHPHSHFRHAPPPVTIPTVVSKLPVSVPTLDTTAIPQKQDQHDSGAMHPLLTPVKDQPESPLTPNSASELRVPGTIPFSPGFGTTGAPPIRPSASFLSHSNSFEFSPSSVASSPGMEHIPRMTPLPSPIVRGGSPGPWHRMRSRSASRPTSRSSLSVFNSGDSVFVTTAGETVSQAVNAQSQRKIYQGLASAVPQNSTVHTSGEFSLEVPGANTKSRHPAGVPKAESETMGLGISDAVVGIKREECLAKNARHRATSIESISESSPSAAGGRSSLSSSSSVSSTDTAPTAVSDDKEIRTFKKTRLAEFEAYSVPGNELKRWKAIRLLGQGTFSKVMLATSEENPQYHMDQAPSDDDRAEEDKDRGLDPRFLVAVKIVENSAAGGASRDRVESSLKRELDILKTVDHPSLVQLKAFSIQPSRALLILPYCPGGDLFDLASEHRELLTPPLIRRVFAELIGAIRYLHKNGIVHRDVKLENVLMNLTPSQISNLSNHPFNHPHPLITLTDLGLSKRVDFVNDPILTTRCGSEDYASPELLMGQPYDGRQTDAWALGVLLYALLEGRLPFDPLPGAGNKMRSRTAHRIARCEWKWLNLNEEEATYDVELQGGKEIVNGLLKRANKRVGLDKVEEDTWVKEAIQVELKRIDENVNA